MVQAMDQGAIDGAADQQKTIEGAADDASTRRIRDL